MKKHTKYKSPGFDTIYNMMVNMYNPRKWDNYNQKKGYTEITYNFPDWDLLRNDKHTTITTLNRSQKEFAKKSLQKWADVANLKFTEVSSEIDADIKFGFYNNVNKLNPYHSYYSYSTRGYAYHPEKNNKTNEKTDEKIKIEKAEDYRLSGQVWINLAIMDKQKCIYKNGISEEEQRQVDEFKLKVDNINFFLEEHADYYLILENSYNEKSLYNPEIKFEDYHYMQRVFTHEIGHALGLSHTFKINNNPDIEENSLKHSIMAYNYPSEKHADFKGLMPLTPQLIDIYAIQQLYGKNKSTHKFNTTYGFNSNTKKDEFSLKKVDDKIVACIWDAGGTDTLDFSKYTVDQKINLNEGSFSDVGGLRGNVSIAYDTVIENAEGGAGNDTLIGNAVRNILLGGKGDDILYGQDGGDILRGGEGHDSLYGEIGDDYLDGGLGNDYLSGGQGNDMLRAGDGDDYLDPGTGDNKLSGGRGNDIFSFNIEKNNSTNLITDFEKGIDKIVFYRLTEKAKLESKISFVSSDTPNKNEGHLSYDKKENLTKIKINTSTDISANPLKINLVGKYEAEDLFC